MNKVLIVGHDSSYYQELEGILQNCGMVKALPSHAYQMTPQALTEKLLQVAQKIKPTKRSTRTTKIKRTTEQDKNIENLNSYAPVSLAKKWDGLAFDLIFANDEQEFWGWSDSKAIQLLEYWANFDEEMAFVLVYDRPMNAIKDLLKSSDGQNINQNVIEAKIQEWTNYNQALLNFYQKFPNRCLLVNGGQSLQSDSHYVNVVSKKFAWSINISDTKVEKDSQVILSENSSDETLINFFLQQLLQQYPDSQQYFSDIQNLADVSLTISGDSLNEESALVLLKQAVQQRNALTDKTNEIKQSQKTLKETNQRFAQEKQQLEKQLNEQKQKAQQDISQQKKQAEQAQFKLKELQAELQKTQQENELLIVQLYQVQEELEKYYLQNQQDKEKLKTVSQEIQTAKQAIETQKKQVESLSQAKQMAEQTATEYKRQVEKLTQEKQQLEKQLNEQKQKYPANIQQENELLIVQLHQVQEELEKYYLENKRLKSESDEVSHQLIKPIHYGAADRVKQDLPYRLGATMVSHSKSTKDLAKLPFALVQEYRAFQKTHVNQEELPPIEEYQDAYEAEKVKKHLSYKLGKTLVDSVKSPKSILDLPVKIGKEIVGFKK